jgi:superfamily II DNA or RNA helicase
MRIPAYWRIGLTATPGNPDEECRQLLEAVTGPIRHETNTMDLVRQGFLAVPKPLFIRFVHPRRYKVWKVAKETGLCGNEARNQMLVQQAIRYSMHGKKVLIIVDRVEQHGQVLYNMIGSSRALFMHGSSESSDRQQAKQLFESGKIRILIGTIYGEGVNMPKMDVVINAAGGKSDRVAIQRIGRVLRIAEGKSEGTLIDVMDEDRGVLLNHSLERFATYEAAGYEPKVVEQED